MPDEDPFDLLGVPRTASPDEIRRAYLRLLPRHKPERDPEGFKRLRGAYELAAATAADPWRPVPSPAPPPRPGAGAPAGEREPPPLSTQPAEEPPGAVEHAAARASSLAAQEAGEGQVEDATAHALHALELYRRAGGREGLDALIRTVLLLQALDAREEAGRVISGLWALFDAEADREAFEHRDTLVLWAVARELNDLPEDFPSAISTTVAAATQAADISRATDAIQAFVLEDRLRASEAAAQLARYAPTLSSFYGHVLSGPLSGEDPDRWRLVLGWLVGLGMMALLTSAGLPRRQEPPVPRSMVRWFAEERLTLAETHVQRLCAAAQGADVAAGCGPARRFFEALRQDDCVTGAKLLDEVRAETARWISSDASAAELARGAPLPARVREEMASGLRGRCGSPAGRRGASE